MTASTQPFIVNTDTDIEGDAAQNAVGNFVGRDLIQKQITYVRDKPAFYLSAREIRDRVACYAPARNHDLVTRVLEVRHAIVLTGQSGSGRETTAIAAIRQLHPDIPIRRFSLEDEDAEEIDDRGVCGYLIRAVNGGLGRLGRCVEAVRAAGGYLAIIADHGMEFHPAFEYQCVQPIEPAHPVEVYRARVNHLLLNGWLYWDEVPFLLEDALPADGRRLADVVGEVDKKGGGLSDRQAEAMNAYRGWHDALLDWFACHQEPSDRVLLVAAATLSPDADYSLVYSAAAVLARRLKMKINGSGLAWCPVTSLPDRLGVERQEDRVVFRRYGYAESALVHTLADYPLARADLLGWLAALPTEKTLQSGQQKLLAQKFADLAAEHDPGDLIQRTALRWDKEEQRADLAFIALSRTCLHPQVGGRVRRALYDWSRVASTRQTLKLTIAQVCEPLGQAYPSIALTRLKHLATHGDGVVRDEVLLTAQSLAGSGYHAEVLTAALAWCAETNDEILSSPARARRRRAGARLFLSLVLPPAGSRMRSILASDPPANPLRCVPGWQATLDLYASKAEMRSTTEEAAGRWLDTAASRPYLRDPICSTFVRAGGAPQGAAPGPAREGEPLPPTRAQIMIDIVQHWAAAAVPGHSVRRDIKDDIVIPLTQPGWRRLLKRLYRRLRQAVREARAH